MEFLKVITAIFMAVILPMLNTYDAARETYDGVYTENETIEKHKRSDYVFNPSENDIVLNGSGLEDAIVNASKSDENIIIWLHEGEYRLNGTVVIDGAKNITVCACPGEKASITAGYDISNLREEKVNGITAWVCDVADDADFRTLFKGDKKLDVTRYPETGYLLIKDTDRDNALYTDDNSPWKGMCYGERSFFYGSDLGRKSFYNLQDVRLKLMHFWVCENTTLTGIDDGRLFFRMPSVAKTEKNDRYFLENVFEELNAPGEWYLDKTENKLYYVPQADDDINETTLFAPSETKLFDILNSENITFKNITIKNTDWCYPEPDITLGPIDAAGMLFPQGNLECEGVFDITKSDGINFVDCDFMNIGNGAIRYHKLVGNSAVTGCSFREIGSNVVFIDGYNTADNSQRTKNIKVSDNLISGYGRNFPSAIGVLITHAVDCEIAHNEIHDGFYTAVSVGWVWGYGDHTTDNIKVCDNLIYDIGQGWLSDMGGIYTLGIQPHTVLSGNKIYNVAADPNEGGYGGWGIYLDEGSSQITVEKNLVYNCGSNSFHQHYGQDNLLRNNIFALSKNGQIRCSRNEGHNEFTLTGNIILCNSQPAYILLEKGKFTDNNNLYWDYTNFSRVTSTQTESYGMLDRLYPKIAGLLGYNNNAVYADPLFRSAITFDFTLADNSPAITEIGFEPWNVDNAGTLTDFS